VAGRRVMCFEVAAMSATTTAVALFYLFPSISVSLSFLSIPLVLFPNFSSLISIGMPSPFCVRHSLTLCLSNKSLQERTS